MRTLLAADLDDSRADFDFNGMAVEPAIAGRTGFLRHDSFSIRRPRFGQAQETILRGRPLSNSLVIF
jgi:hypothetical protein